MQNTSSNSRHSTQNGQPNKNNNRHNSNHSAKKIISSKSHQSSSEKITAPYNFVPQAEKVVLPEWASKVSLDQPFADGISGVLDYEIEALTDILVSKEREQKNDKKDNNARFFTADGKEAIPGTSLKGMIRNLLEIASFSKLKQVNDARFSIRDLSNRPIYGNKMVTTLDKSKKEFKPSAQAGWLQRQAGKWVVFPVKHYRVENKVIESVFLQKEIKFLKDQTQKNGVSAHVIYKALGGLRDIDFHADPVKFHHHNKPKPGAKDLSVHLLYSKVSSLKKGSQAKLVVTGQVGNKHMNFVFEKPATETIDFADTSVIQAFLQDHKEKEDFKHLKSLNDPCGIPIFYIEEAGKISKMGIAQMFRLAYDYKVSELTYPIHKSDQLDFSETLFGHINETTALKGRVSFGLARLMHKFPANKPQGHKLVLNSPKPTFTPSYLEQSHAKGKLQGEYHTYMSDEAKLRGWKRYPVSDLRPADAISDADNQQKNNDSLNSILHSLGAKSRFKGKIRFHNLKAVELGALLWAIQLEQGLSHSIGMGKPFGYGQIRIHLAENLTFADASNQQHTSHDLIQRFKDYMTEQLGSKWQDSEQIHQLLAMMNPVEGNQAEKAGKLRYLPLADHAKAKGAKRNQKLVLEPFKPLVHSKPANSNPPQPKKSGLATKPR